MSFAMILTGEVSVFQGALFVVSQFAGAFLGALLLWGAVAEGGRDTLNLGARSVVDTFSSKNYEDINGIILEGVLSFILFLPYYGTIGVPLDARTLTSVVVQPSRTKARRPSTVTFSPWPLASPPPLAFR